MRPGPHAALYVPVLVFASFYSFLASTLTPTGLAGITIYFAFLAVGAGFGSQVHRVFHLLDRITGNPVAALWFALPVAVLLGWGLIGPGTGILVSAFLARISDWRVEGMAFGRTVGLVGTLLGYVCWRLAIKWVWR